MQISVESGEGLERRMRVGLPPERIEVEVDKRLRTFARSARVPGFRPGKVPLKVLRLRYGDQLRREAFGELVEPSLGEALAQESLRLAGPPQIEPDIDQASQRYAYTAVFEVLPQLQLGSLEGKTIKRPRVEVEEADLEGVIERLRSQRKTWKEVERAARDGDRVAVAYTGTIDGKTFEGGSSGHSEIELGEGRMLAGFEAGLMGAAAGEERSLELRFPGDHPAEPLRDKPVSFAVKVKSVAEPVLPEVNADFVRAFGIEDGDPERFRSEVRGNMERELKKRIQARIKTQVMNLLLEVNPVELPRVLINEEIKILKAQLRQSVGGQMELPDAMFEESARRRVALGLILGEVVRSQGIKVDPDRVRAVVEDMASAYEKPQEVVDLYYGSKDKLRSVESLTLEDQVVDWVLNQARVEEEAQTFSQLMGASLAA